MSWELSRKTGLTGDAVGRFEAAMPQRNVTIVQGPITYPPYIKLTSNKSSAILKTKTLLGAESTLIKISSSTLKNVPDGTPAEWKAVWAIRFHLYRIFCDPLQSMAFIAVLISIIGSGIDSAFKIGNTGHYIWTFSSGQYSVILAVCGIITVASLILLFIKGVKDAK